MSVIVYSKANCPECDVLKMFLSDYHISFEERNCANPEHLEAVKKLGFLGVPITLVHGTPVQGLQPEAILALLEKENG